MSKILITPKQKEQFNRMLTVLKRISKEYQKPEQLRKSNKKDGFLSYEETLEMAYENIQSEAAAACKKVKTI